MYFSLLITRHSKHLLVKFQVPVGMEAIQKACVWPGKEWLTGNRHTLGCKTIPLSQQGSLYSWLLQLIVLFLQLHILQLPTDHQSKLLYHRIPTCLRPLQCCSAGLPKAFLCPRMFMQFSSTNCQMGYKHRHWICTSSLTSTSRNGSGPEVEETSTSDLRHQPVLPHQYKASDLYYCIALESDISA